MNIGIGGSYSSSDSMLLNVLYTLGSQSLSTLITRITNNVALIKSSVSPTLALYVLPVATNPFSSLIIAPLLIFILLFSIIVFNLLQALILVLCVVLNPLRNFLTCPLRIGSLTNNPGMFSSPKSLITNRHASPIPLFSTLQYIPFVSLVSCCKYLHMSASTLTCPGIAV